MDGDENQKAELVKAMAECERLRDGNAIRLQSMAGKDMSGYKECVNSIAFPIWQSLIFEPESSSKLLK